MEASKIKKILLGVLLSDGSLDTKTQRFDLYTKQPEYADYILSALGSLTHTKFSSREVWDKRFGVRGFRVWSTKSRYLKKLYEVFYPRGGRKVLSQYVADRLDVVSLAHMWMCDGYLEHAKNRKLNKVQNIGWFCLESFPREELEILQKRLEDFGVSTSLVPKPWGFGYRIRIGGEDLQRFLSLIYPHLIDCFKYKAILFYKRKETALKLPSAEHIVVEYDSVEDIVRSSGKPE